VENAPHEERTTEAMKPHACATREFRDEQHDESERDELGIVSVSANAKFEALGCAYANSNLLLTTPRRNAIGEVDVEDRVERTVEGDDRNEHRGIVNSSQSAGQPFRACSRNLASMTSEAAPTNRRVSIHLGAMNFGKRTGETEAVRIIHRALERGVDMIDTANAYNDGESERIVGRALRGRPEVRVATKVGFGRVNGRPEGLSQERIRVALDESLDRLGVAQVAVYYLHVPDSRTPLGESIDAMHAAMEAEKVGAFGMSNYASWQMLEAIHHCERNQKPRPAIAQQLYNLLIRQLDVEYFRFADTYRLPTVVYNALAGGLLSGRYTVESAIERGSRFDGNKLYQGRYWSTAMRRHVEALAKVASEEAMALGDLAYAWLASRQEVSAVLIGPATLSHLDQALDAFDKKVSVEGLATIEALHREFTGTDTRYAR
jgi:aryl-alcohol dehydrogenase-like predicted oxidoreductase